MSLALISPWLRPPRADGHANVGSKRTGRHTCVQLDEGEEEVKENQEQPPWG